MAKKVKSATQALSWAKKKGGAMVGKGKSAANATRAATGNSSAVRAFAKNNKTAQRIVNNPGKSAAIGRGSAISMTEESVTTYSRDRIVFQAI